MHRCVYPCNDHKTSQHSLQEIYFEQTLVGVICSHEIARLEKSFVHHEEKILNIYDIGKIRNQKLSKPLCHLNSAPHAILLFTKCPLAHYVQ